MQFNSPNHVSAAVSDQVPSSISLNDLQTLLNQLAGNMETSSTLSPTPGTSSSWFFDSQCYNHMTSSSAAIVNKCRPVNNSPIRIADSSPMQVSHVWDISTANLSLVDDFLVPKLALNLISVAQLCELGLDVPFSSCGCRV